MLLFDSVTLIAGGVTIGLACLDKTLEIYGFNAARGIIRLIIPLAGLGFGVYFIETNPILGWLK